MSIIYLTDCLTSDTKIKLAAILVRVIVWITAMPESLLLNLINLPNQIQTLIEMSYLCQAFVERNSRISLAGRAEAHQWLYELALSSFPINSTAFIAS